MLQTADSARLWVTLLWPVAERRSVLGDALAVAG